MTLRFKWEWEPEPNVRLPELAATWSRLSIDLGDTPVTLVERRDGSGGPRHGLDVPLYPLAEFLAINWWGLSATSHLPSDPGVRFTKAGAGFAWPDLTLRGDRGLVWASLRQRDKAPEHIRFLTQAETVLDADSVLTGIADLIDSTVRRLDDRGVHGTLLQDEWASIQHADQEERDYCLVAAAWGQDPYDTAPEMERLLLGAGAEIGDAALVADLARAVPRERLADSTGWLREATRSLDLKSLRLPSLGSLDWSATAGVAPWRIGYERARRLRVLLDLHPSQPVPIEDLVEVRQTQSLAPVNVDGLVGSEGMSLAVVVGATASVNAKRFAAARAIGRHALARPHTRSLLTRSTQYTERTERAFAAELLAPAEGIAEILGGDFSDEALQRAAEYFRVNTILVQHQVENQVVA
ncbi:hypothetical protein [Nocardioides sp. T2.26MG-1]|uniref:hypothetical protein n=1 Tax=Nocardioides sp. T2.26MG-1 TaxID=3041166 RepID=UPI0024774CCF|nr:hypothetical protein [Nocardioides sp. T2.26MG-1]CAI9418010.1 hypothetical protein HIDPHFAB_03163 [Nocardioides sp. T2.26MG-1]